MLEVHFTEKTIRFNNLKYIAKRYSYSQLAARSPISNTDLFNKPGSGVMRPEPFFDNKC